MPCSPRIWFDTIEPRIIFVVFPHPLFEIAFCVAFTDTYFLGFTFVVVATSPPVPRYITGPSGIVLLSTFFHPIIGDSPNLFPWVNREPFSDPVSELEFCR